MALQSLVSACRAFVDTCGPIIGELLGYQLILADLQLGQAMASEQQAYKAAAAATASAVASEGAAVECSKSTYTTCVHNSTCMGVLKLLLQPVQTGVVLLQLGVACLLARLRPQKPWYVGRSLLLVVTAVGAVDWFTRIIWNAKRGECLSNVCIASPVDIRVVVEKWRHAALCGQPWSPEPMQQSGSSNKLSSLLHCRIIPSADHQAKRIGLRSNPSNQPEAECHWLPCCIVSRCCIPMQDCPCQLLLHPGAPWCSAVESMWQ